MVYLRKKYICRKQVKKGFDGNKRNNKLMKNKNSIALMVDQRVGESERYPFFRYTCSYDNYTGTISLKYNLDIVPNFLERKEE